MLVQKLNRMAHLGRWGPRLYRHFSTLSDEGAHKLCKYFNISQNKAEFIHLKQPHISKLDDYSFENLIEAVHELGFAKEVLIQDPLMFSIMPITLRFRHKVLVECGFKEITPKHLLSYLPLMKQKTIGQLQRSGDIETTINVENRLASYLTQWPTSLTTAIYRNDDITLYNLRLKILQRYLELVLDLSEDEFHWGVKTYPTIRHRPLEIINETLNILQTVINIPDRKIKANLYLLHVDPENLKQIIYKFRSIAGIDIKEILRLHPKLATKKYDIMVEIRKVLEEYGIGNEAQRRCFAIYTLSPDTIRARLEDAKSIPEFQAFLNHPRFLKVIHYKNTAMQRLRNLYKNQKQCLSLNVLSGSSMHYEIFEKTPGDRLGKGKDLIFCISQCLGEFYNPNQIRNMIKRHPFWVNVPLVHVRFVYQKLSREFGLQDIYENCPVLLYPWNKIKKVLDIIEGNDDPADLLHSKELLDLTKLNKSQKLSLALYFLEKNHYFTGNGVWTEEKNNKNIAEISFYKDVNNAVNKMLQ